MKYQKSILKWTVIEPQNELDVFKLQHGSRQPHSIQFWEYLLHRLDLPLLCLTESLSQSSAATFIEIGMSNRVQVLPSHSDGKWKEHANGTPKCLSPNVHFRHHGAGTILFLVFPVVKHTIQRNSMGIGNTLHELNTRITTPRNEEHHKLNFTITTRNRNTTQHHLVTFPN